ncbi:porin [Paenirhodobacter populi]|uniref:Porin n=1 Tax=Paenirhodobacter populi TaxID=2306993 RepID=A0A443IMJ2_9RHOB|nr:porin [Sinirhodobacter populi]RWR06619.1 porin [Sinirhodobacter populi]RWR06798.1 porin [Sinirhodobacter populi]
MKKVLFATTALVFSAGFAAAEVSISGYGRFGASYDSSKSGDDSKSWIEQRLRFNIDALTTTDGGVEFGGRLRLQYDNRDTAAGRTTNTAPALFYVSYGGLRVEVGNVNTAIDSDPLIYNSEIGITERSFGDPRSNFWTYNSGSYGTDNRSGIYAKYSIAGFTAQASYIDPDQVSDAHPGADLRSEQSVAFSYETGPLTVSTAATWNGAGKKSNTVWYAGAAYQFVEEFTAGLNYIDEGYDGTRNGADYSDLGKTITLYGTYTIDAVSLTGYIANNDADDNKSDTVYGLGAAYDLGGGTKLLGSIERGYGSKSSDTSEETIAQLGVKFNF